MKRISGILALLIYICVATTLLSENFVGASNMENIVRWTSLRGILGIGIAFVIITGGIDLSLGPMVGLIGCLLPMFLGAIEKKSAGTATAWTLEILGAELLAVGVGWLAWQRLAREPRQPSVRGPLLTAAVGIGLLSAGFATASANLPSWVGLVCAVVWSLGVAAHLGLIHGLLITRLKLQPFIVTLCAWLIYRGVARGITGDQTQGFGTSYNDSLRLIAIGKPCSVASGVVVMGLLLAGWAAWKLLRGRGTAREPDMVGLWSFLITSGLIFSAAAATRFVGHEVSFKAIGWDYVATPEQLPALVVGCFGWLVVPFLIWLAVQSFLADRKAMIIPYLAVVVSVLVLIGAIWVVNRPDSWFNGDKNWASRCRMTSIFLSLGAMMGGLSFFGVVALRVGGTKIRLPLVGSALTALCWLASRQMGKTSLAQTLLGQMQLPAPFFIMLTLAILAGILLNHTIFGRYLLALGNNEQAARFSGIKTDRLVVFAYVLCAVVTGLGAVLFALDVNSVQPSGHGGSYELFAIAAGVLGGCSLRGGEGTILGVLIGAAVMQTLFNAINILGINSRNDFTILGVVILVGVITDELVKRLAARRRARVAEA